MFCLCFYIDITSITYGYRGTMVCRKTAELMNLPGGAQPSNPKKNSCSLGIPLKTCKRTVRKQTERHKKNLDKAGWRMLDKPVET